MLYAAKRGKVNACKYLIERGADAMLIYKDNSYCFHYLCRILDAKLLKLISNDQIWSLDYRSGRVPLHWASMNEHEDAFDYEVVPFSAKFIFNFSKFHPDLSSTYILL